jgi:hypothetical protein
MSIGCHVSNKSASPLATARADRRPELQASADWLDRLARQFRAAMIFQIPVGFQDEAGFHCGDYQTEEPVFPTNASETTLSNSHPF